MQPQMMHAYISFTKIFSLQENELLCELELVLELFPIFLVVPTTSACQPKYPDCRHRFYMLGNLEASKQHALKENLLNLLLI
jgi:hypothetical protein